MALERREGLSLSDFGEIIKVVSKPDNSALSYALIRYEDGVCMINSSQFYELVKSGQVIPGSIKIVNDYRRTYEKDEFGNPKLDPKGDKILATSEKTGWVMIGAKGLEVARSESQIRGEVSTFEIAEKTVQLKAQNEYYAQLAIAQKFGLKKEQLDFIEARILEEDDEETDAEVVPAAGEVTGATAS